MVTIINKAKGKYGWTEIDCSQKEFDDLSMMDSLERDYMNHPNLDYRVKRGQISRYPNGRLYTHHTYPVRTYIRNDFLKELVLSGKIKS